MKNLPKISLWVFMATVLILPLFTETYVCYILCIMSISVICATGLNLLTGFAGQISLGQSGFVAIGAYASALLMTRTGFGFWVALPIGALIATLIGFLIAFPFTRLKGIYLALVTFGFGAIVETILIRWDSLTRGPDGMKVPFPQLGPLAFNSDLRMFYLIFVITVGLVYLAKNIVNSRVGRAFISIRDSEMAARAMGINITKYKVVAFVLSAFYGGIAGSLYGSLVRFISPDAFSVLESIIYLTMIVVGGLGSIGGSIIGGALLSLLPEILREFRELQELVFGAILIVSLIFLPNGLIGLLAKFQRTT